MNLNPENLQTISIARRNICVPIREGAADAFEKAVIKASLKAGYLEFRLDYLRASDWNLPLLKRWVELAGVPVIATIRRKVNGGEFTGTEAAQIGLVEMAIAAGAAFVDVEIETIESFLKGRLESFRTGPTRIIASYHNFEQTPVSLEPVYQRLWQTRADVLKIATLARTFGDNLRLLDLLLWGNRDGVPVIPVAMGELGLYSRVLAPSRGALFTYAALETGLETAPGQLTADDLSEVYRIHQIDSNTSILGVVGYPLGHSLSPILHNTAFRQLGLNCCYLPFPVSNLQDLAPHLAQLLGLSVTIPHKVAILQYAARLDGTVKATGAANTLVKERGQFAAYNTDVDGVRSALREPLAAGVQKVVLLGAGGAARAAAVVLLENGCHVTVLARDRNKARQFAEAFGFEFGGLDQGAKYGGDLLINATSVGMSPRTDETPVNPEVLDYRFVFDMVYNPLDTRLLKACRDRATTISGLDMFVAQAAKQFELWTGLEAPRRLMRQVVQTRLGRQQGRGEAIAGQEG